MEYLGDKRQNMGMVFFNPKYALDFLLRVQTASKSIALLHLAQSSSRALGMPHSPPQAD